MVPLYRAMQLDTTYMLWISGNNAFWRSKLGISGGPHKECQNRSAFMAQTISLGQLSRTTEQICPLDSQHEVQARVEARALLMGQFSVREDGLEGGDI